MSSYEKLGAFYLGGRVDAEGTVHPDEPILYDAKDLTTHAVCLGMTGSGKTGLGVALLEEALLDGVPVLAIDPKGDLCNLMLSFPQLRPEDFRPWVDEGDALRQGRSAGEQARFLAQLWKKGLATWGQDGDRIQAFEGAGERQVFTPGSDAGRPLAVLRSLDAPPVAIREDTEALNDRVMGCVGGLLGLIGIEADPVQNRETILLANIIQHHWSRGDSLDLPGLIRTVQNPPFAQIGVFDLDSFYPENERFQLAMKLNALVASPTFKSWMKGQPLDIPSLLFTPDGKPRLSIFSIAHLDESQRMFFVTLLMNEVLAWSRTQPGTRTLRAVLYMDEVFGYLPPVANPPSKRPLLTLLKQARASGLGLVLATQNPVDLDYKALSNIGTWFLGRLQTERDKARVLDGLESIGDPSVPPRGQLDNLLSGLDSRVFLMRNVHDDAPTLMHVRWVLSYLAGPMTKAQIKKLMPATADAYATDVPLTSPAQKTKPASAAELKIAAKTAEGQPPVLPPDIEQRFLSTDAMAGGEHLLYRPTIAGKATLHYANARAKVDHWSEVVVAAPLGQQSPTNIWTDAEEIDIDTSLWANEPESPARFAPLPQAGHNVKSYRRWQKMLKSALYRNWPLQLLKCAPLKMVSEVDESEGEFRARVSERVREERDLKLEKLRSKYAPKLARLEERIAAAERRVDKESSQYRQQKMHTAISVGGTVLGALFGRKLKSVGNVSRASGSVRSAGRVSREKEDIQHAVERLEELRTKLDQLEVEFEDRLQEVQAKLTEDQYPIETQRISPRKTDLGVDTVTLLWIPQPVETESAAEAAS